MSSILLYLKVLQVTGQSLRVRLPAEHALGHTEGQREQCACRTRLASQALYSSARLVKTERAPEGTPLGCTLPHLLEGVLGAPRAGAELHPRTQQGELSHRQAWLW